MSKKILNLQLLAIILGVITGIINIPVLIQLSEIIANIFVQFLKWFSIPMIVFSILATTSKMENKKEFLYLGKKILKYTLLTTIIAGTVGLFYFKTLNPTIKDFNSPVVSGSSENPSGLFGLLLISSVVFSLLFSFVLVSFLKEKRAKIHTVFSFIYKKIMQIVRYFLVIMPLAIWAFVTIFVVDINNLNIKNLLLYLVTILLANLTQAIIILPLFLKWKKIPVMYTFKGMLPALNLAFWAKSSGVALPVTINCAKNNLKIKEKIADFSLPLCTTINMNACAAFILVTVLFVSTSNGLVFSNLELFAGIFIATFAAVGNAGVPMGCFTLSCALVAYLGVPMYLLGIILPFYTLVDMLESAINVWSDSCITAIVDKET